MPELYDIFTSLCVLRQIEHHDSLASWQVHALHFNWREHTLNHQRTDFVRIILITPAKTIHDQQWRRLQNDRYDFWVLFVFLRIACHVFREAVLRYFHGDGWTFWIFDESKIVACIGLRENHHVRHAELACSAQKVLHRVSFWFPKIDCSVWVHEFAQVQYEVPHVRSNLSSLKDETFRRCLIFLSSLFVFDVSACFFSSITRFWHVNLFIL